MAICMAMLGCHQQRIKLQQEGKQEQGEGGWEAAEELRPTASIFTPIFPFQFCSGMKVPI